MKTKLVRIGNSRGIRLPKAVIEQAGLRDDHVELLVTGGQVILRSPHKPAKRKKHPRAGWDKAMAEAVRKHGNDLTQEDIEWLNMPSGSDFGEKEWTW